jgi:hypothetical protein
MEDSETTDPGVISAGRKILVDLPCRGCKHSLRGLELTGQCGNCQAPVAQSLRGDPEQYLEPPPPVELGDVLDESGRVRFDLPCRGCGYNVRTLELAARCPECNTPVSLSCQGDLLRYSEPGYVARLARGAYWVRQSTWLAIAGFIVGPVTLSVLAVSRGGASWVPSVVVALLLLVVAAVLAMTGMWWITSREPSGSEVKRCERARMMVRYWMGAVSLAAVLRICLESLAPLLLGRAGPYLRLALATTVAGLAVAYMRYVAELAQRIPDCEMMKKARDIARGALLAFGVVLGLRAIEVVLSLPPTTPGVLSPPATGPGAPSSRVGEILYVLRGLGSCAEMVASLALFVLSISAIRLQWRVCRSLREQAELAQKNWGNAGT